MKKKKRKKNIGGILFAEVFISDELPILPWKLRLWSCISCKICRDAGLCGSDEKKSNTISFHHLRVYAFSAFRPRHNLFQTGVPPHLVVSIGDLVSKDAASPISLVHSRMAGSVEYLMIQSSINQSISLVRSPFHLCSKKRPNIFRTCVYFPAPSYRLFPDWAVPQRILRANRKEWTKRKYFAKRGTEGCFAWWCV